MNENVCKWVKCKMKSSVRTQVDIGVLSLGPTGNVIEFGVKTILVLNLSSPMRCRVAHNNLGKHQLAKLS